MKQPRYLFDTWPRVVVAIAICIVLALLMK